MPRAPGTHFHTTMLIEHSRLTDRQRLLQAAQSRKSWHVRLHRLFFV